MKKILFIFCFVFIFFFMSSNMSFCDDIILQGSVQYTVESAKKLAFDGLPLKLDKKLLEPYWIDEKNKENQASIKQNIQPEGRTVMFFSSKFVKGYCVIYDDKPEYAFYYTKSGILAAVDWDPAFDKERYPYKVGKYNAFGRLISVGLYVSENEQYSYSKSGKLLAHWVGDIGYNAKGKEIARRSLVEK